MHRSPRRKLFVVGLATLLVLLPALLLTTPVLGWVREWACRTRSRATVKFVVMLYRRTGRPSQECAALSDLILLIQAAPPVDRAQIARLKFERMEACYDSFEDVVGEERNARRDQCKQWVDEWMKEYGASHVDPSMTTPRVTSSAPLALLGLAYAALACGLVAFLSCRLAA